MRNWLVVLTLTMIASAQALAQAPLSQATHTGSCVNFSGTYATAATKEKPSTILTLTQMGCRQITYFLEKDPMSLGNPLTFILDGQPHFKAGAVILGGKPADATFTASILSAMGNVIVITTETSGEYYIKATLTLTILPDGRLRESAYADGVVGEIENTYTRVK
jgi:hypothetical protein